MAIVEFVVDPTRGKLTTGHLIRAGTEVVSDAVKGQECRFRTCYPVTLWPLELVSAGFEAPREPFPARSATCLKLELACRGGVKLDDLTLDSLRFYLQEDDIVVQRLYELLFNHALGLDVRAAGSRTPAVSMSAAALRPVGLSESDGLLPYPKRSFAGFRLLQEYFTFPQKFLFFDITGLKRALAHRLGEGMEIRIYLDAMPRFERPVSRDVFRLGATPIVNLFSTVAEPLRVLHTRSEYRLVPDRRHEDSHEVYSVDAVRSIVADRGAPDLLAPLYAFRHEFEGKEPAGYWYAVRRPSERADDVGTDVYLSLVDASQRPLPAIQTLSVQVTCTNRELPGRLELRGNIDRFHLEEAVPARIRCLIGPTKPIRSHMSGATHWQLISHLALSYLSLCEDGGESLREMLRVYNFADDPNARRSNEGQIDAITNVSSRRVVRRPRSMPWNGFCRGLEVRIGFDHGRFSAGTPFLFAAVLEVFLGLYASINSFTQLVATSGDGKEIVKQWPPRAGEQILL
jgi:type VI secretion system protein ImpG